MPALKATKPARLKASEKKALVAKELTDLRIEFTEDDELIGLVYDNTHARMPRAVSNVLRCLTLIAGGSAMTTACKLTGVTKSTLTRWRSQEWYSRAISLIQKRLDDQLDGKFTHKINQGLDKLGSRLENGDPQVQRDGTIIYKPVSAKDAAIITSIFFDKRNLLRNKPTSITTKVSTDERLADLADRFKEIAINAEYTEVSEDNHEQGEQTQAIEHITEADGSELVEDTVEQPQREVQESRDESQFSFSDSTGQD